MDVPLRKSHCVLLLCMVMIFVPGETNGNPLSPDLLKAISKMIERYEKGELTATSAIHYDHDVGSKKLKKLTIDVSYGTY